MSLLSTVHSACVWGYSIVQHDVSTLGMICYLYQRASLWTSLNTSWEIEKVFHCKFNCSIFWEHTRACFQTSSLRHFLLFLDWTVGKSLKWLNRNLLFMHKSIIALWFIRSIFIVVTFCVVAAYLFIDCASELWFY